MPAISEEIKKEEEFLFKHQVLFSSILGSDKVKTFRLANLDLGLAKTVLRGILPSFCCQKIKHDLWIDSSLSIK